MPKRAIQYWRQQLDDDHEVYTRVLARNLLARANAFATPKSIANPERDTDSASAQDEDPFAQYAQIRDKLMELAATLAINLTLDEALLPRASGDNSQ